MSQDQPFIWKSNLGGPLSWVGQSIWGSQGGSNSVSQVDGVSDWHQLAGSVGVGFRKGTMASACLNSRHFYFLPVCQWCFSSSYPGAGAQEGVSLSRRVCVWFFKRNCLGLKQFLPQTQSPLVFAARSCGDLSSWHWNPGLEGLV